MRTQTCVHMLWHMYGCPLAIGRSWFFTSIIWIPRIDLRLSELSASLAPVNVLMGKILVTKFKYNENWGN